jgi:hypothetical protein
LSCQDSARDPVGLNETYVGYVRESPKVCNQLVYVPGTLPGQVVSTVAAGYVVLTMYYRSLHHGATSG